MIVALFVFTAESCKKESEDPIVAPVVSTVDASSVEYQTATLNGKVDSNGGSAITERGFVYSTSNNLTPNTVGVTTIKATAGDGDFSVGISGLSPATTYYFKAYATNEIGTTNGAIKSFVTK